MGGTSSLLEETDWEKADGRIDNILDTVDGAPPTEKYALFYIIKKGFNQREFDVTDSNDNLLYTTRQVPGTVCSFDVLGKEIGSYKLRVHSDLARRYWIVYRFGSQSFEHQEPDKEESEKVEQQLSGTDVLVERPIQLYKRLCVTVSWSRYLAVAAFFGPPTVEMIMKYSEQQKEKEEVEEISKHEGESSSNNTGRDSEFALCGESRTGDNIAQDRESTQDRVDQSIATEAFDLRNTSRNESRALSSSSLQGDAVDDTLQNSTDLAFAKSFASSSKNVQHWLQKHSKSFREKSRKVLHSTLDSREPMEGALDLERPLILCQEIYTRLIGNHQTSRVSKERVLSLLQQDMAQHLKANPTEEGETSTVDAPMIMTNGHLMLPGEDSAPGEGGEESKSAAVDDDERSSEQLEEAVKEEPLVAYWKWEHSFQTQKMKIHLAKNSDLALHIVVAIIVNQVRYERNAIAMTM